MQRPRWRGALNHSQEPRDEQHARDSFDGRQTRPPKGKARSVLAFPSIRLKPATSPCPGGCHGVAPRLCFTNSASPRPPQGEEARLQPGDGFALVVSGEPAAFFRLAVDGAGASTDNHTGSGATATAGAAEPAAESPAAKRPRIDVPEAEEAATAAAPQPVPPAAPDLLGPPDTVTVGHGASAVAFCAVGLGTLPVAVGYPDPSRVPTQPALGAILRAAAEAASGGCRPAARRPSAALFVDTADTYCHPHTAVGQMERRLAALTAPAPPQAAPGDPADAAARACLRALLSPGGGEAGGPSAGPHSPTPLLVLTTKAGMARVSDASAGWRDGPPPTAQWARESILAARARLCGEGPGAPPLFLWSFHHADSRALSSPDTGALEAVLSAAVQCVREGTLLHLGLCNATVPVLDRAAAFLASPAGGGGAVRLSAVQNEWSLFCRDAERPRPAGAAASSRKGVLRWCAARGVPFVAYAPLGGLRARDGRRDLAAEFPALRPIAAAHGVSPQAVALAALRQTGRELGAEVLCIVGARGAGHASEACGAGARLRLTAAEVLAVMGGSSC